MGGGEAKRKREAESYWDRTAREANTAITEKSELEKALEAKSLARLNWEKGGRLDIEDPNAGLQNHIQIGKAALARADRERMGSGALQLGNEANSGHIANLKELNKNNMAREFGAGLEEADAMAHAEATGSVMPLAQLSANRNIARAGNAAGMTGTWISKPKPKNWWDYTREGLGFAQGVGSMIFGGAG